MTPTTHYARSAGINIAYQVVGDGPRDLVYVPGWISNVEVAWEDPVMARFLGRLASFSRLILFDKRGTGMSDSVPTDRLPTLEQRMDDVRAVMDAVGSEHAAVFGHSEGGNMSTLFAATFPDRTDALILLSTYARRAPAPDYPWAPTTEQRRRSIQATEDHWGDPDHLSPILVPSRIDDPAFRSWLSRYFRMGASPRAAAALLEMNTAIDTRAVLSSIGVPTLCLYRRHDRDVVIDEGRWIAAQIPGAELVELPGADHWVAGDDTELVAGAIEEFLTGNRTPSETRRALATVVFTDIVGSTKKASELGDRRWAALLEHHHRLIRASIQRHGGSEIDTAGDGFLARFDGPARAIAAGRSMVSDVRPLGIEIRVGIHTGEIEVLDDGIAGVAVHIGARISDLAAPSEILVSRTVRDLVVGSGISFTDRGEHELRGVDEPWQLLAVD